MGQLFSQLTKTGTYDPASGQANFDTPQPGTLQAAKPLDIGTPPVLNPQQVKPSLQQAAQMGSTPGGANALSPALTKGGTVLAFLKSGLEGALAGRAVDEQAIAASGGRRGAGAGTGFSAGYTLPWQRAQELAQTQVAQAGAQPIQTPYGNLPAAFSAFSQLRFTECTEFRIGLRCQHLFDHANLRRIVRLPGLPNRDSPSACDENVFLVA